MSSSGDAHRRLRSASLIQLRTTRGAVFARTTSATLSATERATEKGVANEFHLNRSKPRGHGTDATEMAQIGEGSPLSKARRPPRTPVRLKTTRTLCSSPTRRQMPQRTLRRSGSIGTSPKASRRRMTSTQWSRHIRAPPTRAVRPTRISRLAGHCLHHPVLAYTRHSPDAMKGRGLRPL